MRTDGMTYPKIGQAPIQGTKYGQAVVVIPAYNEERFIGSVILRAQKLVDRVIVVDDGSVDATAEIAQAAGRLSCSMSKTRAKG